MFSFSDDVLGFGKMTQGAVGTAECGSRPTCTGWFDKKGCEAKRKSYDDCVQMNIQAKAAVGMAQSQNQKSAEASSAKKKQTIIIIAVVAVVVVLLLLRRR